MDSFGTLRQNITYVSVFFKSLAWATRASDLKLAMKIGLPPPCHGLDPNLHTSKCGNNAVEPKPMSFKTWAFNC